MHLTEVRAVNGLVDYYYYVIIVNWVRVFGASISTKSSFTQRKRHRSEVEKQQELRVNFELVVPVSRIAYVSSVYALLRFNDGDFEKWCTTYHDSLFSWLDYVTCLIILHAANFDRRKGHSIWTWIKRGTFHELQFEVPIKFHLKCVACNRVWQLENHVQYR